MRTRARFTAILACLLLGGVALGLPVVLHDLCHGGSHGAPCLVCHVIAGATLALAVGVWLLYSLTESQRVVRHEALPVLDAQRRGRPAAPRAPPF